PDREVALEVLLGLGPPADPEKVDALDEDPRLSAARLTHGLDEFAEPGYVAVVADPEQGPARNVTDPGGLDDEDSGTSRPEPPVPVEHLRGYESVLGRPPGDHRGNPRSGSGDDPPSEPHRREPAATPRLVGRGPTDFRKLMMDLARSGGP